MSLEQGNDSPGWTDFQRRGRDSQRKGRKQEPELRAGSMETSGAKGFGLDTGLGCGPGIRWLSRANCGSTSTTEKKGVWPGCNISGEFKTFRNDFLKTV